MHSQSLSVPIHRSFLSNSLAQQPAMSLFAQGVERVRSVRSAEGKLQTQELLEVCRQILPIVGECPGSG